MIVVAAIAGLDCWMLAQLLEVIIKKNLFSYSDGIIPMAVYIGNFCFCCTTTIPVGNETLLSFQELAVVASWDLPIFSLLCRPAVRRLCSALHC